MIKPALMRGLSTFSSTSCLHEEEKRGEGGRGEVEEEGARRCSTRSCVCLRWWLLTTRQENKRGVLVPILEQLLAEYMERKQCGEGP